MGSAAANMEGMPDASTPSRDRRFFDEAAAPAYGVVASMALTVALAVAAGGFDYDAALAGDTGAAALSFLVMAWLARRLGFALVAALVEAAMLFLLIAFLAPWCAVVVAALNLPLADAGLARVDRLFFGFDRTAFVPTVNAVYGVRPVSVWLYNSFAVQPFLLLFLLLATGRSLRAWTLLTAWGIALIVSLAVFGLLPAFGTPPYVLDFADVLRGARDGSLRRLDASALTGIVTFPSFHAAGATLLAWGFAGLGRVAAPLVLLNAGVIASALVSGGHYLIDLPAGMLVAAVAIALARRAHRWPSDRASGAPLG